MSLLVLPSVPTHTVCPGAAFHGRPSQNLACGLRPVAPRSGPLMHALHIRVGNRPSRSRPQPHRAREVMLTHTHVYLISTDKRKYNTRRDRPTETNTSFLSRKLSQEGLQGLREDRGNGGAARGLDRLEVLVRHRSVPARAAMGDASLTSPHHGPAAHHSAPSQTPDCCIEQSAPCTAAMQSAVRRKDESDLPASPLEKFPWHAPLEPAPISPRKPFRLFCCSHWVAAWRRSAPIVDETQVGDVPEPSLSRY